MTTRVSDCRRVLRLAAALTLALAGCSGLSQGPDVPASGRAGLGDEVLRGGDAESAVRYFEAAVARAPDDPEQRRGLASAYTRAGQLDAARTTYLTLIDAGAATSGDRLDLTSVLLQLEDVDGAETMLGSVSRAAPTARRALLAGLIADQNEQWAAADTAYAEAVQASDAPAGILNNWGVSRLSRGAPGQAAATFERAVVADPGLFTAKNNLAIARAMGGNYAVPTTQVSDTERAMLLHNMGLIAQRRGDLAAAQRLFDSAMAAHPRHYAAAADQLSRLVAAN